MSEFDTRCSCVRLKFHLYDEAIHMRKKIVRRLMLLLILSIGFIHVANAKENICSDFGGHVSGTITDKLIVDTDCLISDAEVRGNVEVLSPNKFMIADSLVTGNIECRDHATVILLNTTLKGNISGCSKAVRTNHPQKNDKQSGSLSLFQKTLPGVSPGDDTQGRILHGGASAVMKYNLWGKTLGFSLKAKNLLPQVPYTLVYYPDPWPGEGLICLRSGVSSKSGKLSIANYSLNLQTDLPAVYDANVAPVFPSGAVGAKIWLVPSEKVDCGTHVMLGSLPLS